MPTGKTTNSGCSCCPSQRPCSASRTGPAGSTLSTAAVTFVPTPSSLSACSNLLACRDHHVCAFLARTVALPGFRPGYAAPPTSSDAEDPRSPHLRGVGYRQHRPQTAKHGGQLLRRHRVRLVGVPVRNHRIDAGHFPAPAGAKLLIGRGQPRCFGQLRSGVTRLSAALRLRTLTPIIEGPRRLGIRYLPHRVGGKYQDFNGVTEWPGTSSDTTPCRARQQEDEGSSRLARRPRVWTGGTHRRAAHAGL